ncbi:MAG: response regulator transcription factor, partial [Acidobacteriota bacterium]
DVLLIDVSLFRVLERRAAGRPHAATPDATTPDVTTPDATTPDVTTVVTIPVLDRVSVISSFLEGARAIVPKSVAPVVWPDSIRTVVAGQYWLQDESIAILLHALRGYASYWRDAKSPAAYRLTSREAEIVNQIASGHSNREVGEVFSICERTVKHHLTNIFAKIGVSSRLELALFAMTHRLLETNPSFRAAIPLGGRYPHRRGILADSEFTP